MVIFTQFFHVSFWLVEDRWHYIPETKTSLSCMAGGFVGPGRSVSERRSREGLRKDNGRTNVNLLLEKRERDWTELFSPQLLGTGQKWPYILGTLTCHDGDDNEKVKKAMGSIGKTTTLHVHHAFLYISLPSLHNYDVKWPNFELTWERDRQGDKFIHLSLNSDAVPSLQLLPNFPPFK